MHTYTLMFRTFVYHHLIAIIVWTLILFVITWLMTVLDAYLEFKKSPREAMFWCQKHGFFRKKHCLPLFPELQGVPDNSYVCPSCYKDAVFTKPNSKLKV